MHIQIINFNLKGISENDYKNLCDQLADTFGSIPGLIAKYWLSDSKNNTYGGVYLWETKFAMEEFSKTDLFNSVATHPNLDNISSRDFGLLEGPTEVTRGYQLVDQIESLSV